MRLCLKEMIPIAKKRKNGEGTLRLRKDGRWEGRVVIDYNEKGQPITKCVTAKTKTECSAKLEKLKDQCGRSSDKIKPDMPFGDWIDFWYQTYCRHTLRITTRTDYENRIYNHIIPEIGKIPLNRLSQSDLQQFYAKEKTDGRKLHAKTYGKGLSDRTIRGIHANCRTALQRAVKEDCPITPGVVRRRLQLILEHAGCKHVRFHDLRHTFATLTLENGMDVKTLSAILGHVSAATTLDIYTHITDDMQRAAAASIDRGIGKAVPQEETSESGQETAPAQAEKPRMTDFKPYVGRKRRSGTGCVSEINDHLFEGRYSPKWPDGKKHARNVYAHTREECEEKLKVLIIEMKTELAELKKQKAKETLQPQAPEGKKGRKKSKKAKKDK